MAFSKKGKEKAAKAALSSAPEALSELEASQLFTEDPLEVLLDEQSDEDFGDLELKERSGKPVKLAEWSAQDFSSIYLRFRPHLERHARRFLRNPSQVDEVVQDAFLYLMVSLPELDSEIGVLRFLKWKTRLLALDVIRASGRAYVNSIDDVQEPESNDPEVYSHLEQQDDAAVVRLALSKLNPRHREVLIASMYEEKSTEEIASQVGLSENATRQLIFRARAAFKKALIGDIDTTGMSAAAILSVAARKAASEGKKVGAAALTLIALVVMSLTAFPGLNRAQTDQMAEGTTSGSSQEANTGSEQSSSANGSIDILPTPDNGIVDNEDSSATDGAAGTAGTGSTGSGSKVSGPNDSGSKTPKPSEAAIEKVLTEPGLGGVMNSDSRSKVFVLDQDYTAVGDNGLTAKFTFNPSADDPFRSVRAEIKLEDMVFTFAPTNPGFLNGKTNDGLDFFVFSGQASYLFDSTGKKWSETASTNARFIIQVIMQRNGVDVKEITLSLNSAN
ncbi:RNA polymerase sigma-70 like domain [Microbacteriaceae bacterium]